MTYRNNAPTMTAEEEAAWTRLAADGQLFIQASSDIHGTVSSYNHRRCRCDECRAAMRAYRLGRKALGDAP